MQVQPNPPTKFSWNRHRQADNFLSNWNTNHRIENCLCFRCPNPFIFCSQRSKNNAYDAFRRPNTHKNQICSVLWSCEYGSIGSINLPSSVTWSTASLRGQVAFEIQKQFDETGLWINSNGLDNFFSCHFLSRYGEM